MFLGSLANYVLFQILLRAQLELPLPPPTFALSSTSSSRARAPGRYLSGNA